jgi:hypothetical protein
MGCVWTSKISVAWTVNRSFATTLVRGLARKHSATLAERHLAGARSALPNAAVLFAGNDAGNQLAHAALLA